MKLWHSQRSGEDAGKTEMKGRQEEKSLGMNLYFFFPLTNVCESMCFLFSGVFPLFFQMFFKIQSNKNSKGKTGKSRKKLCDQCPEILLAFRWSSLSPQPAVHDPNTWQILRMPQLPWVLKSLLWHSQSLCAFQTAIGVWAVRVCLCVSVSVCMHLHT